MWILSQDKKRVVFSKYISINYEMGMYKIITCSEHEYKKLGTYESEARAKEILLDIVKNIRENINYTTKEDDKLTGSCFVYEMPEK